jgi:putative alpha-1,2-mannosidase
MKTFLSRIFILAFSLGALFLNSVNAQSHEPVDHVNPFIGTDFFGHTYPGASLPYAMVHLSPDCGTQGWTFCAGYVYSENSIIGFSHTHWSGVGMVNG